MQTGKSAQENWDLLDGAEDDWWWFHLDRFPSAHTIVPWDPLTKTDVIQAALAVKDASKAARGLRRTKVIYAQVKNVKKGPKIGEVILKKRPLSIYI